MGKSFAAAISGGSDSVEFAFPGMSVVQASIRGQTTS